MVLRKEHFFVPLVPLLLWQFCVLGLQLEDSAKGLRPLSQVAMVFVTLLFFGALFYTNLVDAALIENLPRLRWLSIVIPCGLLAAVLFLLFFDYDQPGPTLETICLVSGTMAVLLMRALRLKWRAR